MSEFPKLKELRNQRKKLESIKELRNRDQNTLDNDQKEKVKNFKAVSKLVEGLEAEKLAWDKEHNTGLNESSQGANTSSKQNAKPATNHAAAQPARTETPKHEQQISKPAPSTQPTSAAAPSTLPKPAAPAAKAGSSKNNATATAPTPAPKAKSALTGAVELTPLPKSLAQPAGEKAKTGPKAGQKTTAGDSTAFPSCEGLSPHGQEEHDRLRKRHRALAKKLCQCDDLAKMRSEGKPLDDAQRQKLASRHDTHRELTAVVQQAQILK